MARFTVPSFIAVMTIGEIKKFFSFFVKILMACDFLIS